MAEPAVTPLPELPSLDQDWHGIIIARSMINDWRDSWHKAATVNLGRLALLAADSYRRAHKATLLVEGDVMLVATALMYRLPSELDTCLLSLFRAWKLADLLTAELGAPKFKGGRGGLNLKTLTELRYLTIHLDDRLAEDPDRRRLGRPRFPGGINMLVPKARGIAWGDHVIPPRAVTTTIVAIWAHTFVVADWKVEAKQQQ